MEGVSSYSLKRGALNATSPDSRLQGTGARGSGLDRIAVFVLNLAGKRIGTEP